MKAGRIEQIGSPEELYFRPRTEFAADFLGESNIIAGASSRPAPMASSRRPGGLRVRAQVDAGARARADGRGGDPAREPAHPAARRDRRERRRGCSPSRSSSAACRRHYVSIADDLVLSLKQLTVAARTVPPPGTRIRVGWRGDHTLVLGVA